MKNTDYQKIFHSFSQLRALIIGDVMVDSYLWGNVERISPEAPVPIVSVERKENRPGGAANVALNIKSLGATSVICSFIGDDLAGNEFTGMLKKGNLSGEGILKSKSRRTTVKSRIIGNHHQMLRIDEEIADILTSAETNELVGKAEDIIKNRKIDVVIFEDYDKGVITPPLIEKVAGLAKKHGIPVAADPKKRNFSHYRNITLFKPNLKEIKEGLKIDIEESSLEQLKNISKRLRTEQHITTVMVTLSERGIYLDDGKNQKLIPAQVRNIADVSGAGDTVISIAALCLALGIPSELMSIMANVAGGQVCEKVGVVPVDKQQLLKELMETVS